MVMKSSQYEAKDDYVREQASKYDEIRFSSYKGRLYDNLQKNIIRKIMGPLKRDLSVLDLPCGTGRIAEVIGEFTPNIVCADISQDMLDVARKKLLPTNDKIIYRILDAEKIDFPDNSFDLIASIKLMHLLPFDVQSQVLREILRVSSRWVVVTYAYNDWLSWIKDYIFRKKYDRINPSSNHPRNVGELESEIKRCGGEVRETHYTFRLFSSEVVFLIEKQAH